MLGGDKLAGIDKNALPSVEASRFCPSLEGYCRGRRDRYGLAKFHDVSSFILA